MYKIEIDQQNALYKLTLDGPIPLEMVSQLMSESRAALRLLRCRPGDHVTLIDASNSVLHISDVASAFSDMIGELRYRARRVAIVASSPLWRLQTRRILGSDRVAFFDCLGDAERWLIEPAAIAHTIRR